MALGRDIHMGVGFRAQTLCPERGEKPFFSHLFLLFVITVLEQKNNLNYFAFRTTFVFFLFIKKSFDDNDYYSYMTNSLVFKYLFTIYTFNYKLAYINPFVL